MRVSVILHFDDDSNTFLAGFVSNVADSLDCLLSDEIGNPSEHAGFTDLIGNRGDDDSLAR